MTFARPPNFLTFNRNRIVLSGKATPKSVNRQSFSNQQTFVIVSQIPLNRPYIAQQIVRNRTIDPINAAREYNSNPILREKVERRILLELTPEVRYTNVEFVEFFNTFDRRGGAHVLSNNPLKVNLQGRRDIRPSRYYTIKEHLRNKTIKLEWYGIHNIFAAKVFNINKHLEEFVVGFLTPNFANYQVGTEVLFGKDTPILRNGMANVRDGVTSLFTGLAIDMLLHDTPIELAKKQYYLANYLEDENVLTMSNRKPNANNFFYLFTYRRTLEYYDEGTSNTKQLTISCTFALFRVRTSTGIENFINLLTVYLPGNPSAYEVDFWANDMNLPPFSPKEKEKFYELKALLTGTNLVKSLHEIYPALNDDSALQDYLRNQLKLNSFNPIEFYNGISW